MNDGELLREYSETGQEGAFQDLVGRHVDLVYSTALRRMGESHAAEDVTQAVFCLLHYKAGRLFGVADLAAWLHRATCWKASEHLRAERRRRFHEQAATQMNDPSASSADPWADLAPHLDENLNRLSEPDRRLILLRYYRRLSLREVGATFGLSEDAARMRIGRALERLRRSLVGSVPALVASVTLDELLIAHAAEPAPGSLAARIAAGMPLSSPPPQIGFTWLGDWSGRVINLKTGTGVLAILCAVNVGLWFYQRWNSPGSSSTEPFLATSLELPDTADNTGSTPGRVDSFRPAPGVRTLDIQVRLDTLWKILRSEVRDGSWPPNDLRQCVRDLAVEPESVLAVLLEAIRDPASGLATRERAVWGLWLLGEESPAMVPEILPRLVGIIRSPEERQLWWHASDVLLHLRTPEGSVAMVADALSANPEAGYSTLRFWQAAVRRDPGEVAARVRPWLSLEEPLRFCAAYSLSLVPGENLGVFLPILAEGMSDSMRQLHVLRVLESLGPEASSLTPELTELMAESDPQGWFRSQLAEVLAVVSPESRSQWPEVDRLLREKEESETLRGKIQDDTASIEELVAGLKNPSVSWMAALELEALGPVAVDALPGLRSALSDPDNDHAGYMAAAIKAIDPESPKPLFDRDDMMTSLRALSETVAELEGVLDPAGLEAVTDFVENARKFTPEQLADQAGLLEAIHPKLRQVYVGELLKLDPALEPVLSGSASASAW